MTIDFFKIGQIVENIFMSVGFGLNVGRKITANVRGLRSTGIDAGQARNKC